MTTIGDEGIPDASVKRYKELEKWCRNSISSGRDFLFDPVLFQETLEETSDKFDMSPESLRSFIRNLQVLHLKKTAPMVKRCLTRYLEQYKSGVSIKELAKEANYPPSLFARYMVEVIAVLGGGKKALAEAMRDPETELGTPSAIQPDFLPAEANYRGERNKTITRLAIEVKEAQAADPMYGPGKDRERHLVGVEFEVVLERGLREMGIPFETEAQLREKGASRTPDVFLSCPLGVQVPSRYGQKPEWKIVSWIDSKALFGDVDTHWTSVLSQAESYVHRFGPGLVIYWFGHAPPELLGDAQGDIIVADSIPEVFLLPTGERAGSTRFRSRNKGRLCIC